MVSEKKAEVGERYRSQRMSERGIEEKGEVKWKEKGMS